MVRRRWSPKDSYFAALFALRLVRQLVGDRHAVPTRKFLSQQSGSVPISSEGDTSLGRLPPFTPDAAIWTYVESATVLPIRPGGSNAR
jgi:hypothetical protein